jgi:hypothetical protein
MSNYRKLVPGGLLAPSGKSQRPSLAVHVEKSLLPTSILPTGDLLVAKNAVSRNFRIADDPSRIVEPPMR